MVCDIFIIKNLTKIPDNQNWLGWAVSTANLVCRYTNYSPDTNVFTMSGNIYINNDYLSKTPDMISIHVQNITPGNQTSILVKGYYQISIARIVGF
jgi:hypothetical protein